MALENAKKFLEQMMKDGALRARMAEKDPAEAAAIAKELGLDVTAEELEQAVKAMRRAGGEATKELSPDEMGQAAGGSFWTGEDAPDGHEMGCIAFYHQYNYQKENNIWCNRSYYCNHHYAIQIDWDTES